MSRIKGKPSYERPPLYSTICANGIEIPRDRMKITADMSKAILGWEREEDYYFRLKEQDPNVKREYCSFGIDYHLKDYSHERIRCWNCYSYDGELATRIKRKRIVEMAGDLYDTVPYIHSKKPIVISKTGKVIQGRKRLMALVVAAQIWVEDNDTAVEEPYIVSVVITGVDDYFEPNVTNDLERRSELAVLTRDDDPEFWDAYEQLSILGHCNDAGGFEYQSVHQEWIEEGRPDDMKGFIIAAANPDRTGKEESDLSHGG